MLSLQWNCFLVYSAIDEIVSRMLSKWWNRFCVCSLSMRLDVHVKTVKIWTLAEHARKFVQRRLSVRWDHLLVCSATMKSLPRMFSQCMQQFLKSTQKSLIKLLFLTINNRNFEKPLSHLSREPKWTFFKHTSQQKIGSAYAQSSQKCSKNEILVKNLKKITEIFFEFWPRSYMCSFNKDIICWKSKRIEFVVHQLRSAILR